MHASALLLVPLLLVSYVSAHGMVAQVTVNGVTDTGKIPGISSNRNTAIRQINTQNPTYGAENPALNCGPLAARASNVLNVNPGDTMSFKWTTADPNQTWRHDTGPIITYLANCGDVSCTDFDSTRAQFFKIKQEGQKSNGRWVQGDLMEGALATVQIPSTLAPGNYLIRHEIISLHIANRFREAEFYPSCIQIKVGGSGTGRPLQSELVTFPGAYSDNDAGIFYRDRDGPYQFPGPAIAAFVNGGPSGSAPNPDNAANPAPSSTRVAPSTTAANVAPTNTGAPAVPVNNGSAGQTRPKQKCKARASAKRSADNAPAMYPRHFSRIMRRALASGSFTRDASPAAR